jgi:anti-anti-sigma factor
MDIICGSKGGFHTLALTGQFWRPEDIDAIERYVSVCIAAHRPLVILDLERISFINSHALGLFVRLHNQCNEAGGKLILYQPQTSVRDMIEVAGLPLFIPLADSTEELDAQMNPRKNGEIKTMC